MQCFFIKSFTAFSNFKPEQTFIFFIVQPFATYFCLGVVNFI